MNRLTHLIGQLWTVLNTRAQALSDAWKGFADFPAELPRKAYAALVRELEMLESMLRRKVLHDALALQITLKPASQKTKLAAPKSPSLKTQSGTHRITPFRLDDGTDRAGRPFHAPRILSFDAILATPTPVKKPRTETRDTNRLLSRLESFYIAVNETDHLARRLARRLAKNQPPRIKLVKPSRRTNFWVGLAVEIDDLFVQGPTLALDSS